MLHCISIKFKQFGKNFDFIFTYSFSISWMLLVGNNWTENFCRPNLRPFACTCRIKPKSHHFPFINIGRAGITTWRFSNQVNFGKLSIFNLTKANWNTLSALIWALEVIVPIIRVAWMKADHFGSAHLKLGYNFLVQRYFDLSWYFHLTAFLTVTLNWYWIYSYFITTFSRLFDWKKTVAQKDQQ